MVVNGGNKKRKGLETMFLSTVTNLENNNYATVTDNALLFFIACYKPYLFDYQLKVK
jgi:hypothetical protein